MTIKTLVAGYQPPEPSTLKGAQLKRHTYFQDSLTKYRLGELHYSSVEDAKKQMHELKPLLVLTFDDHSANELNEVKSDNLIYVIQSPSQIFSRKAEVEEKQEKQNKILSEAEGILADIISGEKDDKDLRHFASLSYNDMYEMLSKAIISDDESLKKGAWDLLFGEGERHSNIIWMRVQMMAEVWEHSKGTDLEQLMLMSMERHIDQETARKMDMFTDSDGRKHHQYMFLDPYGNDLNYIRRLPCATKNQERFGYEHELEELGIPTNYLRIQVEANSLRQHWDDLLNEV